MKILVRLSAVVCSLLIALSAGAQEKTPLSFGLYTTLGAPEGLTIGGSVCFMPELSLRAGLGLMPSLSYSSRVDVDKEKAFASYAQKLENPVDLDINMKSGWVRGQLLLDYHPFRNPFRVTAGLFLGRYQARGSVQLVDHKTGKSVAEEMRRKGVLNMPLIRLEENGETLFTLQPDEDASINASVASPSWVQPYIGIGYGFAVPRSRVSFFGDLGLLYNGSLKLSSPNLREGNLNSLVPRDETLKSIDSWTRLFAILNLGVSIRL